ncbi:MAG: adenylosuccinate synthase [Deferribacterota bacterium]|nr:adenylosuccinate synthase [Deferribacterota bacterium]
MQTLVVVGAQWGDEGKGKIIDFFGNQVDVIIRYQGGHNAGHTVVIDDNKYILHLLPSGILRKDKINIIGNGVVVDPKALLDEIDGLKQKDIHPDNRLYISDRAHVIMPYHKIFDKMSENKKGIKKIGTTGRGIGPTYVDKIARIGIRVGDMLDKDLLYEKISENVREVNEIAAKSFDLPPLSANNIYNEYLEYGKKIKEYVCNTSYLINKLWEEKKKIMFEGAQGTLLDVDHGTYPFVTSSNSTTGGASTGSGLPPTKINGVAGVFKAYTTRVGSGPFPTELNDKIGEQLRDSGMEFGATTGRPRRCGWLDLVACKYAVMVNGINYICLTKLDVLNTLDYIYVCTAYKYKDRIIKEFPSDINVLKEVEPIYKEFKGWKKDISKIRNYNEFPIETKGYLDYIRKELNIDYAIISVGANRKDTLVINEIL